MGVILENVYKGPVQFWRHMQGKNTQTGRESAFIDLEDSWWKKSVV